MTMAHDLIIDQFSSAVDREPHLTTWYAQGHSDGLGDRLLMFDNTSAPSWEILRFAPALARDYRFEKALRDRVERLASFHHPAFPSVRPIKELGHEDGLAVVSTYASGARLSEALKKPRSAAFAMRLIRQLVPALTALEQHGAGMAHGALDADRIVVTDKGQVTIREHMVGAALGSLELSPAKLWADFGILASPTRTDAPTLDSRSDLVQLGLVTLSLMAGHRIGPDEYPHKIAELLDDIENRHLGLAPAVFQLVRSWLERALQLDGDRFDSAQDANDALEELREEAEPPDEYFVPFDSNVADAPPLTRRGPRLIAPRRRELAEGMPLQPAVGEEASPAADDEPGQVTNDPVPAVRNRLFPGALRWVAVAAAVLAGGEALWIGRLMYARAVTPPATAAPVVLESQRPGANVPVEIQAAGVAPLLPTAVPPMKPAPAPPDVNRAQSDGRSLETQTPPKPKEQPAKAVDKTAAAPPAPIGSQRSGGFRLSSSVEVHVLDGDRVLGSSADGPIVAPVGQHEFEFVNSSIGYRERRVIVVRPGVITPVSVTVPNGRLNINALPWAAVWIDGNSFGETPLGNVSIAPGEHEIVFRHPQLGERREKTMVRADATTRVSVNLQR